LAIKDKINKTIKRLKEIILTIEEIGNL